MTHHFLGPILVLSGQKYQPTAAWGFYFETFASRFTRLRFFRWWSDRELVDAQRVKLHTEDQRPAEKTAAAPPAEDTMTPSVLPVVRHLPILLLFLGPVVPERLYPATEDLVNRNADFGVRLYQTVSSRTDDNVLLSPFVLSAGLMALLSGTGGSTLNQLLQGLTLAGLDPEVLPDQFRTLRDLVPQRAMNLQQGMAIFPAEGLSMSLSYQDLVQSKFGGKFQSLLYTSVPEALDAINTWAQEQTGTHIQQMLSTLDPQTQLLVVSAASYQARFSPNFNQTFTQNERFYVNKYRVVMVPMMFRAGKFFLAYDRSLKAGVLQLPMADGAAMLAVLPDEVTDITSVEEEVTSEKIQAWIQKLKKTKLEVQLPCFMLERSYSLKNILQTLDITQVFQDDADISKMGAAKGVKLSEVYHKSVISVDESSSDPSGAGGESTVFSTPPPRLTFNRPFIFIIYQEGTGSLLLMGRVTNPAEK
uniref:Serpin peptidase inhibitor, clade A (Alpha-1 antiproteinase, antitrypsin), member 10a n=1 Tax=Iconisemion striatum TaxID=60296 RepID=A0A1A7WJ93_9TELE